MGEEAELSVGDVAGHLESLAATDTAEAWDNVGLLVGDRASHVRRVMTCLTVTPSSAAEAVEEGVDLVVSHHPLPFRGLKRLTTETPEGRMLLELIRAGVDIYSPHTAFDSAARGINQRLAEGLELTDIEALRPAADGPGAGRVGVLDEPLSLDSLAARVRGFLDAPGVHVVGPPDQSVTRVAVACGAAGELLDDAIARGCDALVLGETRFHTCLKAEACGVGLLLPGHYASERFGVEALAAMIAERFPDLTVWPSRRERDPLRWVG